MQLVLPVSFRKQDSLNTFVKGANEHLVSYIQSTIKHVDESAQASQRICVITGASESGKSHLLLATCEQASLQGLSHQYLDMSQIINMPTELLIDFINKDVVCIDNLQVIDAMDEWQRAVFDTINQFTELNGRLLLIATSRSIPAMEFKLPDLKTRLMWGTNFTLHPLSDEDKQKALVKHMHALGVSYTDDVVAFLINRTSRSMHELITTLDALDKASLEEKRKITIPFVKSVLKL
jgi:DnaA family protein